MASRSLPETFARLDAGLPYYDIPADASPLMRTNFEVLNVEIAEGWRTARAADEV